MFIFIIIIIIMFVCLFVFFISISIYLFYLFFIDGTYLSFVTLYLTQENTIVYSFASGALDVVANKSVFPFGNVVVGPQQSLPTRFPFSTSAYHKLKTFSFFNVGYHFLFMSDIRGVSGVYSLEGYLFFIVFYYIIYFICVLIEYK